MGQDLGKACVSVQGTAWVQFRAWVSGWASRGLRLGYGILFAVGNVLGFG